MHNIKTPTAVICVGNVTEQQQVFPAYLLWQQWLIQAAKKKYICNSKRQNKQNNRKANGKPETDNHLDFFKFSWVEHVEDSLLVTEVVTLEWVMTGCCIHIMYLKTTFERSGRLGWMGSLLIQEYILKYESWIEVLACCMFFVIRRGTSVFVGSDGL